MLREITPAITEPVTLAEVKAHLRVDHADEDARITALITSARQRVEQMTGRALAGAGYTWSAGSLPFFLPLYPAAITEITYRLADEDVTAVADDYRYIPASGEVVGLPVGSSEHVISFDAEPENIPAPLISAIKLLVEYEFDASPEDKPRVLAAAENICDLYRVNMGV